MSRRRNRKLKPPREGSCVARDHKGRGIVAEDVLRPIHVDGAIEGERVLYRKLKRRGDHDDGLLIEVLEPSPLRVEPPCLHYGLCGGCNLQHLSPDEQVAHKQTVLLDLLRELGGVEPSRVLPPLRGPTTRYRRRARLGVRKVDKKGKVLVGFREKGGRLVADLLGCEILTQPGGELIPALSRLVGALSIAAAVPQIEYSSGDSDVALTIRVLEPPTDDDLERLRSFAAEHDIKLFLQPGGLETVAPLDPIDPHLHYALPEFDADLAFLPTDFVQVNGPINRAMVHQALELLEVGPNHRVLDLFCGLGNFTIPLARRSGAVVGVEGDAGLVERAEANAARNGVEDAKFFVADLYGDGATGPWMDEQFDRILIDPPRTGAPEVVADLGRLGAERIVYVACGPESLARDAGVLVHDHGYVLEAAGIMDMFPHTAHVESMALFVRPSQSSSSAA